MNTHIDPKINTTTQSDLPDITYETRTQHAAALSQVGMEKMELPILLAIEGREFLVPAEVSAFVSLDDPQAKGIHMSRLYLELKTQLQSKPFKFGHVKEILAALLKSHVGLSTKSYLRLKFVLPIERKALVSDEVGYRHYPVTVFGQMVGQAFQLDVGLEVMYSSTCPCSAALSRRLLQDGFIEQFGEKMQISVPEVQAWLGTEKAIVGVPHAQRSLAQVKVRLSDYQFAPSFIELIDRVEKSLGTPVQAAVKRVDEQEFARLNAQNLMFCEDASRRIRHALEAEARVVDYDIRVEHQESLHPHNAVSRVVKGIDGGFSV